MSALTCGCDEAVGWLCEAHARIQEILRTTKNPTTERFAARLAAADQMQDTTASRPGPSELFKAVDEHMRAVACQPSPAEQFRAEAVAVADAVQTREDLMATITTLKADLWQARQTHDDLENRIATLESEVMHWKTVSAQRWTESRYVLELERQQHATSQSRIAAILATFYHAELSISSTQPIIALALELNPDLVERAR